MESDPQPNEEVTSANTEINTLTDRLEADPAAVEPAPSEEPTRSVETFWSRLDSLMEHLEVSNQHKNNDKVVSFTNQPERVCISSDSDINTSQTQTAISEQNFNSFRVAIARPFLDVKSIQLLRASIPNAVTNIPDQECTFWYYRLPVATFSGTISISVDGVSGYSNATFTNAGIITPAPLTATLVSITPSFPAVGLATYFLTNLTGLANGSRVTVAGVTPSGYNGTFIISDISIPNVSFRVVNATTGVANVASATLTQTITDYIDWGTAPYSVKTALGSTLGYFAYPTTNPGTSTIYVSNTLTGTTIGTITRSSALFLPAPNSKYLKMVRLLPSYYKPELFDTDRGQNVSPPPASPYGWNRTFTDYPDLASELAKSCAADPAYDFATQQATTFGLFIPNDISLTYNSTLNKFCLTGNNSSYGSPSVKYFSYLSAGFNDPNLWEQLDGNITSAVVSGNFITFTTTSSTSSFFQGLIIFIQGFSAADDGYNGAYRINSFTSTSFTVYDAFPPASPVSNTIFTQTKWTAVADGPESLKVLTAGFLGFQSYDHTLIFGIGGQPFQLYRTLNLRLGFTWNGLTTQIAGFFPLNITTLTSQSVGTSVLATFLNRLRPVPFYYTFSALDTGLSASPYTSIIYTADGYANLVNTNTVSLYADFTGGSTYDSMANTQLLACIPMNASNLGVTFYNTTLYCPLTKISDQIYEIEIRMLTDTGVPYVIPNSAIVSLELALTY